MMPGSEEAIKTLRAAWDDMMAELGRARDAIDQPELFPAPASERNLAEGYRYLMGFLHGAIERAFHEDARFPVVRHALQILNKGTIDNADAIYFACAIDGRQTYVLRGRVGDHRHWRAEAPAPSGRIAPQYMIFEATDGCIAGDSGSLAELRPGVKAHTGRLDSTTLEVAADGSFEIVLAPERPAGHSGNFIATHRRVSRPHPDHPDGSLDRYATYLSGRQLFYDWEREDPAHLSIARVGQDGEVPPPYSPAVAGEALVRAGGLVRGQMHFWNAFYTNLLETYGKPGGAAGEPFMPRNRFNAPNAASGGTGGGQSTNIYAGGAYELGPDDVLLVESHTDVAPQYIGFHLANLWGESHDFANHQSSLNGCQAEPDRDGVLRWIIAHRDPGIPNWVDTTGHPEGFMTVRWAYTDTPPKDRWPRVSAKKIPFMEIRTHLPDGVRRISAQERRDRIRVRQAHVQRRYRVC
jgi:hypothetical protein